MRPFAGHFRTTPASGLRWVAASCALLVWVLGLIATSPQLHTALHSDADHQDHACAVTLFSHGVEAATPPAVLTAVALVLLEDSAVPAEVGAAAAPRYRLLPGRAPPVR